MSFLDYFRAAPQSSASVARDRLQVIVAHQRRGRHSPDYLQTMQYELLQVVRRYVQVNEDALDIQLEQGDDGYEVLAVNVILPDGDARPARASMRG